MHGRRVGSLAAAELAWVYMMVCMHLSAEHRESSVLSCQLMMQ